MNGNLYSGDSMKEEVKLMHNKPLDCVDVSNDGVLLFVGGRVG